MKFQKKLVSVIAALSCTAAVADGRDFTIVNSTNWTVYNIWISDSDNSSWGRDVLRSGVLGPGRSTDITFTGGGSCYNDIRIRYGSNADVHWDNINLCDVNKMTIWYNFETRTYNARWE